MVGFTNIAKKAIDPNRSVQVTLDELDQDPPVVLACGPAQDLNPEYMAEMLEAQNLLSKRSARGAGTVTMTDIRRARETDIDRFSRLVVKDWPGAPKDDEGNFVPFSVDNCREFLTALPPYIFDRVRALCVTPGTFLGVSKDGEEKNGKK